MTTDYRKWWDDFRSRTDQQEQHIRFLKEKSTELGLDSAQKMISVGAGDGDIDATLIKHYMPTLIEYIGIEPDDCNRKCLDERLRKECPHLQTHLVSAPIPHWSGPCHENDQKVDLVLAVQVLWYIKDKVQTIRHMMTWVKPGGSLIIGHACDDFIFARLLEKHCYNNGEKEYYLQELKEDLKLAGFTDYDEYLVPCRFRTLNPDERMLKSIVALDSATFDKEQMRVCLDRARELCQEQQPYAYFNNVFIRIRNQ